jgi:hypothetical protein
MILLTHMFFGAVIASKISNPFLAIILAFLSHYLLDFIPHIEYSINNLVTKEWRRVFADILKVALDFCLGLLLISIFSDFRPITLVCVFVSVLPDGFSFLYLFFERNRVLKYFSDMHQKKVHFLRNNKKISKFWRIFSQAGVVVISILILI